MTRITARISDPTTSHEAGDQAEQNVASVRGLVLLVLLEAGPLTHEGIVSRYQRHHVEDDWPPASVSGIRTRCSELVRDGLVEQASTDGQTAMGRRAHRWQAVSRP